MGVKNRRTFFKITLAGIVAFFIYSWNRLTEYTINQNGRKTDFFPFNKNKAVTFTDHYIIVNTKENTRVFTSRCSHLGCKINKLENNKLVCPCHGSEYDLNGKVLKGPAFRNLETVSSKISADGKEIEIRS